MVIRINNVSSKTNTSVFRAAIIRFNSERKCFHKLNISTMNSMIYVINAYLHNFCLPFIFSNFEFLCLISNGVDDIQGKFLLMTKSWIKYLNLLKKNF